MLIEMAGKSFILAGIFNELAGILPKMAGKSAFLAGKKESNYESDPISGSFSIC